MVSNTRHHKNFFDQSFNKERLGFYILSVQISTQRLAYTIFEPSRNKFIAKGFINQTNEKVDPTGELNILKNELKWVDKPFKEVKLIIENEINTLIPQALFDPKEAAEYLKLNHPVEEQDIVDFDIIKNCGAVNIYNLSKQLLEKARMFWPDLTVFHSSSVLIDGLFNQFKNKTDNHTLFVNLRLSSFDLVYFKDGKLNFYNLFKFKTKEDFIYFLLAAVEQLQLNPEDTRLLFLGEIEKNSAFYEIAYKYIRHLEFVERNDAYIYADEPDDTKHHHDYVLFNVLQCGS